jgi:ATP-binding cassette subfamily B protein/subfamily B ATP-binding cassette protein MsbA
MKPFFTIVIHALRYKWSIAGATAASLLIALLWGASISTIYPVVEIVLDGKTGKQWLANEISKAQEQATLFEKEVSLLEDEIHALRQTGLADESTIKHMVGLQTKLYRSQSRVDAEQSALKWYQKLEPWFEKWAPDSPYQTLMLAIGWLLATSLIKGTLLIISTQLVARVAHRTVADLRRIYYRKALAMDQQRVDDLGTSSMMTYLSHNMLLISAGLQAFFGRMIREPMKMITCLAAAAWISFPLLLITLATAPLGWFIIRYLTNRMKKSTGREIEGMTGIFQTLMETFNAIKTVKVFNREAGERKRFKRNADSLYRISLRISLYDSLLRPITEMLGTIAIAMAILAGAYLVLNQHTEIWGYRISERPLTPSMLLWFFGLLAGASDPARKMSEVINQLVRAGMISEALLQTFDNQPHVVARKPGTVLPMHNKSVRFENVNFSYRPNQPVVNGVTLEIPFAQTVAIVGPNGCGKSSLMNLLARFYDPQQGRILVDDVDIRDVSPRKLRQQIAWVTQDSTLFKGTIWENIAYGNPQASDDEIRAAADCALVTEIINEKPEGFQTQVGDEGRQLSAGQRQRVALARAILADPRILILDEATSQIDGKTESVLHHGLADFIRSRTTFVVTHRVSSLKLADRVLIMDGGRVVYDGNTENAWLHSKEFNFLFNKTAA